MAFLFMNSGLQQYAALTAHKLVLAQARNVSGARRHGSTFAASSAAFLSLLGGRRLVMHNQPREET
jgi:hypothetical protein